MTKLTQQVKTFKSISDKTRLRILKMLQVKPLCVCEITDVLGLSASTVSEHLSVLRASSLVISKKRGKIVFYELNFYSGASSVSGILSMISCLMDDDETIQLDRTKAKKVDCRVILARKQ
jgi:ArsR family transcriptional regulator